MTNQKNDFYKELNFLVKTYNENIESKKIGHRIIFDNFIGVMRKFIKSYDDIQELVDERDDLIDKIDENFHDVQ